MNCLEKKFLQQLRDRRLAAEGDHVLVAVSGGADSMALLHLFFAVLPVVRCQISVAHCNFTLREKESEHDEQFVAEQCAGLGVRFFSKRFDTLEAASRWKMSVEETARELRYEWFSSLLREQGMTKIATGHHVGDNAETMLFNLFRGTSLLGLKGIRSMRGSIIRPLLLLHREDIAGYLAEKGIAYRTDASNFETDYDRNFIRNRVIPLVEERFRHKLFPSLQRLSEQAGELEVFLEEHFERLVAACPGLSPDQGRLDVYELAKLSTFEQKELFKRALQEAGASADATVLDRLVSLLEKQPGRKVVVSKTLVVERQRAFLCFRNTLSRQVP